MESNTVYPNPILSNTTIRYMSISLLTQVSATCQSSSLLVQVAGESYRSSAHISISTAVSVFLLARRLCKRPLKGFNGLAHNKHSRTLNKRLLPASRTHRDLTEAESGKSSAKDFTQKTQ